MARTYDHVKRAVDVLAASIGILLTLPVQVCLALVIALKIGRPILFRQRRPGLDGQIFELVKFRTMKPPSELLVTDEQRMTSFGAKLRSTSLDELPTLWNVLKGDMSLVGPRPLLPSYLSLYTEAQSRRHEVRPGITGLAQVNGRNTLDWEERLRLDVEYVDRRSIALDAQILLATVRTVLKRDGISAAGHVTMAEFRGMEDREA